jgi:ubiquinone biosynthesis protein UbiJ
MDKDHSNWQFIVNIVFGIIAFFSGWLLKITFGLISRIQEEGKISYMKTQEDYRRLAEQVTDLAISLPQTYVSKEDFNQLVKAVHHRFDRLEEKLDHLKENK